MLITLHERSDLIQAVQELDYIPWPTFSHYSISEPYWWALFEHFCPYQLAMIDETERVMAIGHSIPLCWDGTVAGLPPGWDAALEQGVKEYQRGLVPDTLCALAIVVAPDQQGKGLSQRMLTAMLGIAARQGFKHMLAPVRPVWKSRYPLTPMEEYVKWKHNEEKLPFDPWLRVHARFGARTLAVAPASMIVRGSVQEWEEWTRMRFPASGEYIVPGALVPVKINERGQGCYEEPNVWMCHTIKAPALQY
ncbi:N-acetyltransferase [Ktedonosporobacter rubrisoli]|uniref:N-acetyltransferase n=1 Tax=Ktedonosporobacter rubrisoli TaxID=2509675 RepID=A0A4P6K0C2_KTERU|nr:GNAT family N-acetyltransferase [Ktedonosporobacter rubrisoli]QBD81070.1 N-acetyltransferase [Ktedonosporobacter rubrisoli]